MQKSRIFEKKNSYNEFDFFYIFGNSKLIPPFILEDYIPEVNCYFLNGYHKRTFKLEHFNPINSIQRFRLFKEANAQTYSSQEINLF